MKKPISAFTDKSELTKLMANARRLGNEEIYNQAFRRRCELEGANIDDSLHSRFMEVLAAYEGLLAEKHGRAQAAGRTRQKMAKAGIEQCLIDWSLDSKESDAFALLSERGMLELTGEFVVTQFPDRFDDKVVAAAKARLEKYS
ncbi:hypothetical protein HZY97_16830 [Sphingomonas sp. R-74633]|uniref:hypothetical protein n=1 Tax=Sphingomonas sp. R-74633 TaxID=2751188 RepID=UPI0015D23034|nr:hypothetical protein [Sphingomonas sp. R-74633]NYT42440.1 hypothetical protein [Sphingomonas sp. R-74633]